MLSLPRMKGSLESLRIGASLVREWDRLGDHGAAVEQAAAVLRRVESHGNLWSTPLESTAVEQITKSMISRLQPADDHGRPDLALLATEWLRAHASTPHEADSARIQRGRVLRRAALPQPD